MEQEVFPTQIIVKLHQNNVMWLQEMRNNLQEVIVVN